MGWYARSVITLGLRLKSRDKTKDFEDVTLAVWTTVLHTHPLFSPILEHKPVDPTSGSEPSASSRKMHLSCHDTMFKMGTGKNIYVLQISPDQLTSVPRCFMSWIFLENHVKTSFKFMGPFKILQLYPGYPRILWPSGVNFSLFRKVKVMYRRRWHCLICNKTKLNKPLVL